MRHFESIFLSPVGAPNTYRAQVFDLTGEPDFRGTHVRAALVLHSHYNHGNRGVWTFLLRTKTVNVITTEQGIQFSSVVRSGRPEFLARSSFEPAERIRCGTESRNRPTQRALTVRSSSSKSALTIRARSRLFLYRDD